MKKLKVRVRWNNQDYWEGYCDETILMHDSAARTVADLAFHRGERVDNGNWSAIPMGLVEDVF